MKIPGPRNSHQKSQEKVIDYSPTINRYTLLDAYPLLRIDEIISKIAKYHIFSTLYSSEVTPIKYQARR